MPKEIPIHIPPPPPPKFEFFVQLVTLAAVLYLIRITLRTGQQLETVQNDLETIQNNLKDEVRKM